MATMSFRTALLLILIGYGVVGEIPWTEDLLISVDKCEIVAGLESIVGDRCLIDYFKKPGNASLGNDLLISKRECEILSGQKVDGRCWFNPKTLNPNLNMCTRSYLKTASGCIGPYLDADCLPFRNGVKVGNLCVIINKATEVEAKPEPNVPQHFFDGAVIIPEAPYQKNSDNGFKPLTRSENYYVQSICGQTTAPRARIVNGEIATSGQFPWAIDLGFCTGILISPRHVLSAAHCFYSGKSDNSCSPNPAQGLVNATIRYGGVCRNWCFSGTDMKPATINRVMYAHDNPSHCSWLDDIAIVLLNEDVEFNDYVKPICLGKIAHDNFANVKSVGFGRITNIRYSNVLRYIKSNITKIDQTQREILSFSPGKSVCFGDSGGPLQGSFNGSSRTYLAGILSRMTTEFGQCAPNSTAIHTFVPAHLDWVCQQTGVCELD